MIETVVNHVFFYFRYPGFAPTTQDKDLVIDVHSTGHVLVTFTASTSGYQKIVTVGVNDGMLMVWEIDD
jgi:hypothetical protein